VNKRILIVIVVLLLAAVPASAWLLGKRVESGFNEYYSQATTELPQLKILKRDYQRGFYSSTETVTFEFMGDFIRALQGQAAEGTTKAASVTVRNHIKHGPFPGMSGFGAARIDTEIVLTDELKKEVAKIFGDKKPLEIQTLMGFGGGGTSTISSPSFNTTVPGSGGQPVKVAWDGLKFTFDFTKGLESFVGQGGAPRLEVTEGEKHVLVTGIKYQGNQRRIFKDEPWLFAGKQSMSVDEMQVTNPQDTEKSIQFKTLSYDIDIAAKDDFIDISAKMGANALQVAKENYGPAQYHISFKHLHGRTLGKLYRAMMQVYADPKALLGANQAAVWKPMQEHGMELLKHNPEFSVDRVSFKLGGSEAIITANAKLNGATPEDFGQMMALIPKLEAKANVQVPEAMLPLLTKPQPGQDPDEQALRKQAMEQQVAQMTQQGYVKREGGLLKSQIEFKAGQLTVNGKPFNPLGGAAPPPMEEAETENK
jgi:uncharacterized protein YdgA (DUF945 family)